jgi:hypothetical protein
MTDDTPLRSASEERGGVGRSDRPPGDGLEEVTVNCSFDF